MTIGGNNGVDLNRLTADMRQSQISVRQQPARVERPEVSPVSERQTSLSQAQSVESGAASALSVLAAKTKQIAAGIDNSTPGLKEFADGLSNIFSEDSGNPHSAMGKLSEMRNSYWYAMQANDSLTGSSLLSQLE